MGNESFHVLTYTLTGTTLGLYFALDNKISSMVILLVFYFGAPILAGAILARKNGSNTFDEWDSIVHAIALISLIIFYLALPLFFLFEAQCSWWAYVLAETLHISAPFAYALIRKRKNKDREFESDAISACYALATIYVILIMIYISKLVP